MPWTVKDATSKTKKANSPKKRRQWRDIANGVLKKTGNEGRAIREANGIIGRKTRTIASG